MIFWEACPDLGSISEICFSRHMIKCLFDRIDSYHMECSERTIQKGAFRWWKLEPVNHPVHDAAQGVLLKPPMKRRIAS